MEESPNTVDCRDGWWKKAEKCAIRPPMMAVHLELQLQKLTNGMGKRRAADIPSTGIGRVPIVKDEYHLVHEGNEVGRLEHVVWSKH